MKRYKYLLLAFLALNLISCKKVLDTKPYDIATEEIVWGSKSGADGFVYETYNSIMSSMYSSNIELDAWTTNSVDNRGTAITRGQISREDDFGFNKFTQIRRCNLIIQKVTESENISDPEKVELIAEAKFLRAMTYFWLAKRFGRIVWIDKVLMPDDDFNLPLESVESTWNKIMGDVDAAIAGLPETSPAAKANKYVAMALKTEVGLQAAAYTGDDNYLRGVVSSADSVINSGNYSLDANYEGVFNEKGRYSNEIILATYRSKENTYIHWISDAQNVVPNINNDILTRNGCGPLFKVDRIFEAWGFWGPSQNLVDNYLVIDDATGEAVRWDQSTQFTSNVTKVTPEDPNGIDAGEVTGTGRINEIMYNNRDKRFAASIVYDSCYWFDELVTTCIKGNLNRTSKGGLTDCCVSQTNYYWRKGVYNVVPRVYYGIRSDYHWVIFRLGEVYLNKAEALLKLNRINEAVTALNVTRTFHGGLPPSTAANSADAWTDYKRERRVELAKESQGDYYFSLLRWGKYGGDANHGNPPNGDIPELQEPATYISITKNRKSYQVVKYIYNNNQIRNFDNSRRYLLPIPQSQIVRNPNYTQNPGW